MILFIAYVVVAMVLAIGITGEDDDRPFGNDDDFWNYNDKNGVELHNKEMST